MPPFPISSFRFMTTSCWEISHFPLKFDLSTVKAWIRNVSIEQEKKKPFEFYAPQQNLVKKKKQNNKENWNII